MAQLTVLGAHGETITLQFTSSANAALAQQIANQITSGVENGSIVPFEFTGNPVVPPAPAGESGEFVQEKPGLAVLPSDYTAVVVNTHNATVFGGGAPDESVLSGNGGLTFFTGSGSGFIGAGGGKNLIIEPTAGGGNWLITTGNGKDTILALSGSNTISAGSGNNQIFLGSGNNIVNSAGNDTISITGGGADTIEASGHHKNVVFGGFGLLTFVGGAGASTVLGQSGSETVFGGSGGGVFVGGSAGHNVIFGGTGADSIVGGGDGDQLYAGGSKGDVLRAGAGNETLSGTLSSGKDKLYAGSGSDSLIAGTGSSTLYGGTGSATLTGGAGKDIFAFVKGQAGGTDVVQNFNLGSDKVAVQAYGPHAVQDALNTQQQSGGATIITLPDGTKITFTGVATLNSSNFT
jgi:Ca2+-binding RTX toxin-like protein